MPETVYIIDSNKDRRARYAAALAGEPFAVHSYDSARQFLDQTGATSSGCVIASAELPDGGARALIDEIRQRGLPLVVIVVGETPDLSVAVDLMRAGAADFLEQPVSDRRLLEAVRQAVGVDF